MTRTVGTILTSVGEFASTLWPIGLFSIYGYYAIVKIMDYIPRPIRRRRLEI